MLTLSNADLHVSLLDPHDPIDRQRVGTRYAWGGYIWQVEDAVAGPLLAGPEWPASEPDPYNGQGLPESFRSHEFGTERPLMLENGTGFVIGVGDVNETPAGALEVTAPCMWEITPRAGEIVFTTEQSGNGYACRLTRRIAIDGRQLVSSSRLENLGERPLPLHWFAHPFFALTDRWITCGLPASWGMADNQGFHLDAENRLHLHRPFPDLKNGHFELLILSEDEPLRAVVSHPTLSEITLATDFVPALCPVWGNSATWSIEPYLVTELAPDMDHDWALTYVFGTVV
jgi:hypothetical protein